MAIPGGPVPAALQTGLGVSWKPESPWAQGPYHLPSGLQELCVTLILVGVPSDTQFSLPELSYGLAWLCPQWTFSGAVVWALQACLCQ